MHDAPDSAPPPRRAAEPLVRVRGLSKRFGGTLALAAVDLDIHAGRVLALLGPNGAGKSTLIKVLAGVHHADEGEVTVAGHPLGTEAAARAMSFIHQDLGLVEWMTVAENIALGTGYPRRARADLLAADPQSTAPRPWTSSPRTSTRTRPSPTSRGPNAPWSPSPARWPRRPRSSSSTSRPPACRPRTAPGCSTSCTPCATEGTPSSTSPTGWTRCTRSPTPSPCCATAASSARARSPTTAPPGWCATSWAHEPGGYRPSAPATGPPVLRLDRVRTGNTAPVSLELRARGGPRHGGPHRRRAHGTGPRPRRGPAPPRRPGPARRTPVSHRVRSPPPSTPASASCPATVRRRAAPPN